MFYRKYLYSKDESVSPLKQTPFNPPHSLSPARQLEAKLLADKAIEENKIFIIQGPYPTVRSILRQRGWVEKFYQFSSYRTKLGVLKHQTGYTDDSDFDEEENKTDRPINLTINEDEAIPLWKEEDGFYGYLYKLVQKCEPTLFWGARRDFFDQKCLLNHQMINHFLHTVFTTKIGLCIHLRDLHWYQKNSCNFFYPRSYQLAQAEEKSAFEQDFCLTASISLLKMIISNDLTLEETSNCTNKLNCIIVIPDDIFQLAYTTGEEYLKFILHEDIDEPVNEDFSINKYEKLLEIHDSIKRLHVQFTLHNPSPKCSAAQKLLENIRQQCPQFDIDGTRNIWILKPGAKSRGRGIKLFDELAEITKLVDTQMGINEKKYVIQKYIEKPLLICKTKFDIRQWFLVTDWNPLTIWFYKDSYIRFCSQQFTLDNFDLSIHLSNNSIQKHYTNDKSRSGELPDNNMWTCHEFKDYLRRNGAPEGTWEQIIFEGMKNAVLSSLLCCQEIVEHRKNTFELFGADFMLDDNYNPWLIEINSSPCMAPSTSVTASMCPMVLEDTLKVVLDLKKDKNADIGLFILAYKQNQIINPAFFGVSFKIEGQALFLTHELRTLSSLLLKRKRGAHKMVRRFPTTYITFDKVKMKCVRKMKSRNKSRNATTNKCCNNSRRKNKTNSRRQFMKFVQNTMSPSLFLENNLSMEKLKRNNNRLNICEPNSGEKHPPPSGEIDDSDAPKVWSKKRLKVKMVRCSRCKSLKFPNKCKCHLNVKDLNLQMRESVAKIMEEDGNDTSTIYRHSKNEMKGLKVLKQLPPEVETNTWECKTQKLLPPNSASFTSKTFTVQNNDFNSTINPEENNNNKNSFDLIREDYYSIKKINGEAKLTGNWSKFPYIIKKSSQSAHLQSNHHLMNNNNEERKSASDSEDHSRHHHHEPHFIRLPSLQLKQKTKHLPKLNINTADKYNLTLVAKKLNIVGNVKNKS